MCVVYCCLGEAEFPGRTLFSRRLLHHSSVLRRRLPQSQLARWARHTFRPTNFSSDQLVALVKQSVGRLCVCESGQ